MTKTILLWLVAVAAYTYLFYNQWQGYNTTVFALILLVLASFNQPPLCRLPAWWLGACTQVVTAVAVSWHATLWLQFMYIISLFAFIGLTYSPKSSLYVAWVNGLFATFFIGFLAYISRLKAYFYAQLNPVFRHITRSKLSLYIVPFSITTGFYYLYSWANPDFWIDFSFIDFNIELGFFWFFGFGLMWLCPLFFPWGNQSLVEEDAQSSNILVRVRQNKHGIPLLALKHENKQGVVLFGMLNTLISFFLGFNLLQLFIPSLQQHSIGYSVQVHEGFNTLIISIISAISLIMFYFRANQNFYLRNTRLVKLAVVWIALNALLALFICYKNTLYVEAFGLTFKRIWVYIAMILTVGGLLFTLIKVKRIKSNVYLFRQNVWMLYLVIACYGLVDWTRLITWYNINYAQHLDMYYIQGLNVNRLPYLQKLIYQKDPRIIVYQGAIAQQIEGWKKSHAYKQDWQSRNWDEDWLRKKLR